MSPKMKKNITGRKTPVEKIQPGIELPTNLIIGNFKLSVDRFTSTGIWDKGSNTFKGVSGKAWLTLDCASPVLIHDFLEVAPGYHRVSTSLEVVQHVRHSETKISLLDAYRFEPGIQVGQTLKLDLAVTASHFHDLARGTGDLMDTLLGPHHKGEFLVSFEKVTIALLTGNDAAGRIIEGTAGLPADREIHFDRDGFHVSLSALTLTPAGATATVTLVLPESIASAESCGPASLSLGTVGIDSDCNLYVEKPGEDFGPWLIGDTGLIVEGHGYIIDLSDIRSPGLRPAAWMGLVLDTGSASGEALNPSNANTGYLAAPYSFSGATIIKTGFQGQINLNKKHTFHPVNPQGYEISIDAGFLILENSQISTGQLGPGSVRLPLISICDSLPGHQLKAEFSMLSVQPNLDLWGEVSFKPASRFCWGELTRPGKELVSWRLEASHWRLYLPANPLLSFSPDNGSGFIDLSISDLEAEGVTGITAYVIQAMHVFSPDIPGGVTHSLDFQSTQKSWLRVGHKGLDGEIRVSTTSFDTLLGNKARFGYVGFLPFKGGFSAMEEGILLGQYAASAVYDSQLDGRLYIPEPCNLARLEFQDMALTSTAHLVGGNVVLPPAGVELDYWKLKLVPTGNPSEAGVMSVRTGRVVFTAAGISEPVHFKMPFKLNWGEILANGNLGQLFIDYNNFGQKFDGLPYTPQDLQVSTYRIGRTDGYLATCGTVHFNFFGTAFVNIKDARNDAALGAPWNGRYVTVPKLGEPNCPATDLTLHGSVSNSAGGMLGIFDFQDVDMNYYEEAQDGFLGKGASTLGMLHSDALETEIEIHRDATDMHIDASSNHDLDLGVYRVGTLSHVAGCVRFEGPLLNRIAIWAALERSTSSGFGVLEPKTGFSVEVNLDITRTSLNFYASGNIMYSVAASAVDIAAKVHLLLDYQRSSVEGEMNGVLNCNSFLGGLEGNGQISWYVDSSTQYLQGRLKMGVGGWTSAGMEGGLFIGHNCPKEKAWILLHNSSEHFGVSQEILPNLLTGIYGYGYVHFGASFIVFEGDVELFAGLGAFETAPPGHVPAWPGGLGLPYVVGSAGVHVSGEILAGLVSASGWADLDLRGPVPIYFEGTFGLEGCVAWAFCSSVDVTAGLNSDGFYLN